MWLFQDIRSSKAHDQPLVFSRLPGLEKTGDPWIAPTNLAGMIAFMTVFIGNCCGYFVFLAKIDAKRAGTQMITASTMA